MSSISSRKPLNPLGLAHPIESPNAKNYQTPPKSYRSVSASKLAQPSSKYSSLIPMHRQSLKSKFLC